MREFRSKLSQRKAAGLLVDSALIGIEQRGKLLDEIIERAKYRTKADIKRWRNALSLAENIVQPRRQALIELYEEVWLDTHLRGIIENTRKASVKCEAFEVTGASGKVDESAGGLFQSQWFFELIDHIIDSAFWGHSLIDIKVEAGKVYTSLVPRLHVEPIYGQLLAYPEDVQGLLYRQHLSGYYIEIGRQRDLGLFNPATPMVLFKKNAMQAWAEYCDIFGMPFRSAYTASNRKEDLDRLDRELANMGKAAYGVFRKGIEEFKLEKADGSSSSTGNTVYDALAERVNSELSKLILGNTMTSDSGKNGARAHAEVHEDVTDAVLEMDKRLITFTVNDQVIPALIKQGVTWLKGLKFRYPKKENRDQLVKHLDVLLKYKTVPNEFIEDKLGIPVGDKTEPAEAPVEPSPKGRGKRQIPSNNPPEDVLMKMHRSIAGLYGDDCC
jgi:hypothetical protein